MEKTPIVVIKKKDYMKAFTNLQETFQFLKGFVSSYSDHQLYTVINQGIDDHKE